MNQSMNAYGKQLRLLASLAISGLVATSGDFALAQIVPDNTLRTESSVLTPNVEIKGIFSDRIDGGAIRGANLFHSFREFNIGEGRGAFFSNPLEIQNIFSRVTGNSRSEIRGTLGVLGDANLFFLNPNGIFFGPNAKLDMRGSFLGTTASGFQFSDGTQFSATNSQTTPTLTISVPLGLQFGQNAGEIRSQEASLNVQSGKTLALVGGNITLEGGNLEAAGGRIELGSVGGNGLVSLNSVDNGFVLGYKTTQNFQDIQLSQKAEVSTSGNRGGDIQLQGGRIKLTDGSSIFADTLGTESGGNLNVNASESVEVVGKSANGNFSNLATQVRSQATGSGGNLTIETKELIVTEGAYVSTTTFGAGNAGNLTIRASESVEVSGTSGERGSGLFAQVNNLEATGSGGNLTIDTKNLIVRDGASVSSPTFGAGNAGSLTVRASDSVELIKGSLSTQVNNQAATGSGGNLTIETGNLTVRDGGRASTSTSGLGKAGDLIVRASDSVKLTGSGSGLFSRVDSGAQGNGGNLTVQANSLTVEGGAEINTSTDGKGDAGNLIVRASDLVDLVGLTPPPTISVSKSGNTTTTIVQFLLPSPNDPRSGLFARANAGSEGKASDITIETRRLRVRDNALISTSTESTRKAGNLTIIAPSSIELDFGGLYAQVLEGTQAEGGNIKIHTGTLNLQRGSVVSVGNLGTGVGGNLEVTARNIFIGNRKAISEDTFSNRTGQLIAETASGNGGNVTLNVENLLLLRFGSVISTTAGTRGAGGNGGNIMINAPFILAVPSEDSNIRANAFEGTGGTIRITSQNIFGIQEQPRDTPNSDITASSTSGVGGTIIISAPNIDPIRGVDKFPEAFTRVSEIIAQGCESDKGRRGRFEIKEDREKLPTNPVEVLSEAPASSNGVDNSNTVVEAQGWIRNPNDPNMVFFKARPFTTILPSNESTFACGTR